MLKGAVCPFGLTLTLWQLPLHGCCSVSECMTLLGTTMWFPLCITFICGQCKHSERFNWERFGPSQVWFKLGIFQLVLMESLVPFVLHNGSIWYPHAQFIVLDSTWWAKDSLLIGLSCDDERCRLRPHIPPWGLDNLLNRPSDSTDTTYKSNIIRGFIISSLFHTHFPCRTNISFDRPDVCSSWIKSGSLAYLLAHAFNNLSYPD